VKRCDVVFCSTEKTSPTYSRCVPFVHNPSLRSVDVHLMAAAGRGEELERETGKESAVERLPERAGPRAGVTSTVAFCASESWKLPAIAVVTELVRMNLRRAGRRAAERRDSRDLCVGHHERASFALLAWRKRKYRSRVGAPPRA
jgi:hypothetical protein